MEKTRDVLRALPSLRRLAPVKSFDIAARTVNVMWGAGAQVRRYNFWEDEVWIEELDMSSDAVDLTRLNAGAPVLDSHARFSVREDVVGVVEKAWLQDGQGMAQLKFSRREDVQPLAQDVADGVVRAVSIGYDVSKYEQKGVDKETGYRIMRAVKWRPFEISFVPVGADPDAGARSRDAPDQEKTRCQITLSEVVRQTAAPAAQRKETSMSTETEAKLAAEAEAAERAKDERQKEKERQAQIEREAVEKLQSRSAGEVEAARKRAIENFAKANKVAEAVRDAWITQGYSLEEVSKDLLSILEKRGETNPAPLSRLGLTAQETRSFSMMRAIRACYQKRWDDAPFELEASRAVAQKLGKIVDENKFYVPYEVMERPIERQQRDLTVATAGAGGFLVSTDNIGFIEMLRNRSVAMRLGARRLSGLQGSVTVPRQSAAATAVWLANEASTATESQQTFVQMALTPKTVSAYTEISRQLLLQSSPGAEGIVSDDLAQVVAIAADLAVLNGSGASGQPTGIINTAGIGGVTGTSLAAAGILEFQSDVAGSNVTPLRPGYATTPAVAALLMVRPELPSTGTTRLWTGNLWDGALFSLPAMSSNQLPSANMLFGDWQEVVIAEWGVLEVEINPFAGFQAGIVGIRALYSLDVGVRRPFAFSLATSIT